MRNLVRPNTAICHLLNSYPGGVCLGVHAPFFSQYCWGKWPLYRARVSKSWISRGLAARVTIGMKLSKLARIVVLVAGLKNFLFFVFSVVVVVTAALVANKQPTK